MFRALALLCVRVDSGKRHPRRRLFPSICGRCSTVYCGIKASQFQDDVKILEHCTTAIERWFLFNGILLNDDKSDSAVLSTAVHAHRLPSDLVAMVAGCSLKPACDVSA